jgi:dATP/dGTP diphosphohydrolase, N-terminal
MDLTEGTKHDTGKTPLDLLSPSFLNGVSEVLKFGAEKYEPYNWAKGIKYSRVFSAMQRHMWAFWSGEEFDAETGMPHLWHAGCCLMFLTHYEAHKDLYEEFNDIPDIYKADPTTTGAGDTEEELSGTRGLSREDPDSDFTAENQRGTTYVRGEDKDWPSSDRILKHTRP